RRGWGLWERPPLWREAPQICLGKLLNGAAGQRHADQAAIGRGRNRRRNLLVSTHRKTFERVGSERCADRDVGGIAAARHQHTTNARNVMARVERMPSAAQTNF